MVRRLKKECFHQKHVKLSKLPCPQPQTKSDTGRSRPQDPALYVGQPFTYHKDAVSCPPTFPLVPAHGATTEHCSRVGDERRGPGQRQSRAQSDQRGGHAVQLCRWAKTTYIMGVQKASLSPGCSIPTTYMRNHLAPTNAGM